MAETGAKKARLAALEELYRQRIIGIQPRIAVITFIALSEGRTNFFNAIEMEKFLIRIRGFNDPRRAVYSIILV